MDIVSSFSGHNGGKAGAASRAAAFDAISFVSASSTGAARSDVRKCLLLAQLRRTVAVAKSLPDAGRPEPREPFARTRYESAAQLASASI
jgi:hypothetical protein